MTDHAPGIGVDFQDEGSGPGQEVRASSPEGSVKYISFDDAPVLKRISRFTLNVAVSPKKATELLEFGVDSICL